MYKVCETFKIWNDNKPFTRDEDAGLTEHLRPQPQDGVMRPTDVTEPELTWFPAIGVEPHAAVLVCPGGGYSHLSWNKEGTDICKMLNLIGITAFALKYRCPDRREAARADAARALRFIRANSVKFNIRKNCLGMMGFSAGAHLTAVLSAPADPVAYQPQDEIDQESCRPDFAGVIYPWSLCDQETLEIKPEFNISPDTPPTFIMQTEDDPYAVNSIAWFLGLKRAGVDAELHIWSKGGHGYGAMQQGLPVNEWPQLYLKWLQRQIASGTVDQMSSIS